MKRIVVIGAGIVGLATARALAVSGNAIDIVILEKEGDICMHQTGRNSGVIHSGIYYKPGSLKAKNCRSGRDELLLYCRENGIAHEVCGKVIVATHPSEFDRLSLLAQRGLANGVNCQEIDAERLNEIEPYVDGQRALHVRDAGIVDFCGVGRSLQREIEHFGGSIQFESKVRDIHSDGQKQVVVTEEAEIKADIVINCAGLQSDYVTAMTCKPEVAIIPFRGEYFELTVEAQRYCKHLVYPVPDPAFPFLGVHFTRMIEGGVECGPNAVLAFAREGYRKTDINFSEFVEIMGNPAFIKLAARHWKMGLSEFVRSWSKRAFVHALQRLIPDIRADQLIEVPAGIRAQALSREKGLVDDFLIQRTEGVIHVANAPSPAATASLAIGRYVAQQVWE